MPDENKGLDAVPVAGGETPPTDKAATPVPSSPAQSNAPSEAPAPTLSSKPTGPEANKAAAPEKPPVAAKPAAPAAAKPAPKPEGPKPLPWESELATRLRAQYGSGLKEASTYLGQNYLVVDSSIVYEILLGMREDEQFDYCVDITSVHYPKREQPFDLIYVLYSFPRNERVRIKTLLNDGERVRTAVRIWPTANWLEREVFDMFGIEFEGHPDLKRILLPDGWKGHPLRKDYPILQQDKEWVQINLGIESGQ
jgi:NADH-quinone oxidoreductase subunit C